MQKQDAVPVILDVFGLTKTYFSGSRLLTVLRDVTFAVSERESVAVVGPSGSGKTTLLGLCAGLDAPTSGTVRLAGLDLNAMTEDERAAARGRYLGFVFQTFQLIPTLTALENVMVPAELRRVQGARARAEALLADVGLKGRTSHYPAQLSGGEQQRVGLARAFINRPRILFADEPTGNLDTETGRTIQSLMFELNRSAGTTLLIVTHDLEIAARADRMLQLQAGHIIYDGKPRQDLARVQQSK